MDYQSVYNNLIANAQKRQKIEIYTERHHILPKSLGGNDESDNLVDLTAREHFIVHLLLAKIYGGPMITAAFIMSNYGKYGSKEYGWLKEQYFESIKGRKISEITKAKMSIAHKNKVLSTEHKNKLSTARKGKQHTDETKLKISKKLKGKTKSTEHCDNLSNSHKEQVPWNKNIKTGFNGNPPWNKGIRLSEEQKNKLKISAKNRPKICRINDRKEMDIGNFVKWCNKQIITFN